MTYMCVCIYIYMLSLYISVVLRRGCHVDVSVYSALFVKHFSDVYMWPELAVKLTYSALDLGISTY